MGMSNILMLLALQASGVNVLFLPLTVISTTLGLSQERLTQQ